MKTTWNYSSEYEGRQKITWRKILPTQLMATSKTQGFTISGFFFVNPTFFRTIGVFLFYILLYFYIVSPLVIPSFRGIIIFKGLFPQHFLS